MTQIEVEQTLTIQRHQVRAGCVVTGCRYDGLNYDKRDWSRIDAYARQ